MTEYSFWLVLAGVLLVSEILTGTFYLVLVAVGAFLGGVVAYFGYPIELQIITASVFSVIASLLLQSSRRKKNSENQSSAADKLDVGNLIEVDAWNEHGMASVMYRGAQWQGKCIDPTPVKGLYQVSDVQGNTLLLTQYKTEKN